MIYGSVCSGIEAATAAWHPLGWMVREAPGYSWGQAVAAPVTLPAMPWGDE